MRTRMGVEALKPETEELDGKQEAKKGEGLQGGEEGRIDKLADSGVRRSDGGEQEGCMQMGSEKPVNGDIAHEGGQEAEESNHQSEGGEEGRGQKGSEGDESSNFNYHMSNPNSLLNGDASSELSEKDLPKLSTTEPGSLGEPVLSPAAQSEPLASKVEDKCINENEPPTSLDLSQPVIDTPQPCLDLSQPNDCSSDEFSSLCNPNKSDLESQTQKDRDSKLENKDLIKKDNKGDEQYNSTEMNMVKECSDTTGKVNEEFPSQVDQDEEEEEDDVEGEGEDPRMNEKDPQELEFKGLSGAHEGAPQHPEEPREPPTHLHQHVLSHIPYSCDSLQANLDPPQHPIRFPIPRLGDFDSHALPQNLHHSPPVPPHNLHESPDHLHSSPAPGSNMGQSPAHPLNLHQSPAHPVTSPTAENLSSFQRTPYHPPADPSLDSHLQGLPYSMGSQYSPYNHHYFNNANSYSQNFMSSHGFPHNFSSEMRSMMGSHEMYMNQSRMHDPHSPSFKPEFGHTGLLGGLGNHHSPRQDPYSFSNSDEDGCSPNRTPAPFSMGFSSMPMPLIAPKAKKPRKPRKPRSPKPDPMLTMQLKEEDSRSSDLDQSYDDDCDGKLVIAEHEDDVDLKTEELDGELKEKKPRRKHNRFNGLPEEEVMKRLLPDLICPNLDILIIGINPGLYAAFKQHHYAGPGNHFWKCMYLSGLIPRPMNADNDRELLGLGIGFTNIVERTTRASQELTRQEIEEGAEKLIAKIKEYNPRIAVFNGKGIYEVFSGQKEFIFGKQPEKIGGTNTYAWVMPNSSARCAQLPRALDKVPFYSALKKFRDYLHGEVVDFNESDVVFPEVKLQNFNNKRIKEEEEMETEEGSRDGMESRIDPETGKKRRGRPPKPRPDGTLPPPKRKRIDEFGNPLPKGSNPIDPITGKKKRGRPKKGDLPLPSLHMHNGLVKSDYQSREDGTDSDAPSSLSKTPTRLPPFSPNFRGMGPLGKDDDSECGEQPTGGRLRPSMDGEDGGSSAKDMSRSDSLPDLAGRLGAHSPMGKNLSHSDFDPTLPEDETSHSEDRRPDSARSMIRPQTQCNFSNPTTPVDGHGHFPGQPASFAGFPMKNEAAHHSPNYPPPPPSQQQQQQSFHAPYRTTMQDTPPHQSFDSPQPQAVRQVKSHDPADVSSKSITGLESLVDQIPAIAENDSGVFSGSGGGSHPPTPRSVGPYSPGQYHGGAYYSTGGGYTGGGPPGGNTPGSEASYPTDLSTSTNYNVVSTTSSHSPVTHTNFSVSSLAHSSVGRASADSSGDATITGHTSSADAFSVSNLASSYASPLSSEQSDISKYPPGLSSNPYMSSMSNSSMFSPGGLMSRGISPATNFMSGGMGSSMAAGMAGMAGMGMAGMAGMYGMSNYGQYSSAAGAYTGAAQAFAAAASGSTYPPHGLHMPNPSYPYPSPYSQSPYTQSPYF